MTQLYKARLQEGNNWKLTNANENSGKEWAGTLMDELQPTSAWMKLSENSCWLRGLLWKYCILVTWMWLPRGIRLPPAWLFRILPLLPGTCHQPPASCSSLIHTSHGGIHVYHGGLHVSRRNTHVSLRNTRVSRRNIHVSRRNTHVLLRNTCITKEYTHTYHGGIHMYHEGIHTYHAGSSYLVSRCRYKFPVHYTGFITQVHMSYINFLVFNHLSINYSQGVPDVLEQCLLGVFPNQKVVGLRMTNTWITCS